MLFLMSPSLRQPAWYCSERKRPEHDTETTSAKKKTRIGRHHTRHRNDSQRFRVHSWKEESRSSSNIDDFFCIRQDTKQSIGPLVVNERRHQRRRQRQRRPLHYNLSHRTLTNASYVLVGLVMILGDIAAAFLSMRGKHLQQHRLPLEATLKEASRTVFEMAAYRRCGERLGQQKPLTMITRTSRNDAPWFPTTKSCYQHHYYQSTYPRSSRAFGTISFGIGRQTFSNGSHRRNHSLKATVEGTTPSSSTTSNDDDEEGHKNPNQHGRNNLKSTSSSITDIQSNGAIKDQNADILVDENDEEQRIQELVRNWRNHSSLQMTIVFPTWRIENPALIHDVLHANVTQDCLATRHKLLKSLKSRLHIVRDLYNDEDPRIGIITNDPEQQQKAHVDEDALEKPTSSSRFKSKLVLLHPEYKHSIETSENTDEKLLQFLDRADIKPGPDVSLSLNYDDWIASYILTQVLPKKVHPAPTSFETVGHVAHLNLKAHHQPYAALIGEVLLECLPNIQTVISKRGEVDGPYRTYDFDIVAGDNSTKVTLAENNAQLSFDLKDVYWCSRLGQERLRLLATFEEKQVIADPFCGVGALCIQAAMSKNCTILANDWNPAAVKALKKNAKRNGVAKNLAKVACGDAYDFLMDLGLQTSTVNNDEDGDEDEALSFPDHVVMNYPVEAPRFLGALRWWPVPRQRKARATKQRKEDSAQSLETAFTPRVHVYTFARPDDSVTPPLSAEEVAVSEIASYLVPGLSAQELNSDAFDCNVEVHCVRDVAPGKVVYCVSFSATAKLIRYMQGQF